MANIINKLSSSIFRIFSPKAYFVRVMSEHLSDNASVYNGLYTGIKRVFEGAAKKPEKVIKEWCSRTEFNFENSKADKLCKKHLLPLCEKEGTEQYKKWSSLLLKSVEKAGITYETSSEITLNDQNVNAYIEWDGEELYPEDAVEIINPAWYKNGKVLEQGHCKKRDT